jgi:hypothetical protein
VLSELQWLTNLPPIGDRITAFKDQLRGPTTVSLPNPTVDAVLCDGRAFTSSCDALIADTERAFNADVTRLLDPLKKADASTSNHERQARGSGRISHHQIYTPMTTESLRKTNSQPALVQTHSARTHKSAKVNDVKDETNVNDDNISPSLPNTDTSLRLILLTN